MFTLNCSLNLNAPLLMKIAFFFSISVIFSWTRYHSIDDFVPNEKIDWKFHAASRVGTFNSQPCLLEWYGMSCNVLNYTIYDGSNQTIRIDSIACHTFFFFILLTFHFVTIVWIGIEMIGICFIMRTSIKKAYSSDSVFVMKIERKKKRLLT